MNHKTPPTDYGSPMKPFFHWNPKLLELGRQIGQINFEAFGIFSAELSVPILVQWVPCPQISPCPCFLLFNHSFYKKLSLYIHIPNIYLGLGFEFWLQRIISHRVSVVRAEYHGCQTKSKTVKSREQSLFSSWSIKFGPK